jgi:hypothetical protein
MLVLLDSPTQEGADNGDTFWCQLLFEGVVVVILIVLSRDRLRCIHHGRLVAGLFGVLLMALVSGLYSSIRS